MYLLYNPAIVLLGDSMKNNREKNTQKKNENKTKHTTFYNSSNYIVLYLYCPQLYQKVIQFLIWLGT